MLACLAVAAERTTEAEVTAGQRLTVMTAFGGSRGHNDTRCGAGGTGGNIALDRIGSHWGAGGMSTPLICVPSTFDD